MARHLRVAALLLALGAALAAADVSITLLDAQGASYLQDSAGWPEAGLTDLAALVTSLLKVPPVRGVDAGASDQVARIIAADPFSRPAGVLLLSVAGAPKGLQPESAVALTRAGSSEAETLRSLVALSAARGVEHTLLDVGSLPGCGEACLEGLLQDSLAALQLDANYTRGTGPMRGTLAVRPSPGAAAATLDLARVPDRLLAVELASALQTARNLAADSAARKAAGVTGQQPQLAQRALVSLQALREAYGAESAELAAGAGMVRALLAKVASQLSAAFDGRLVVITSSFDSLDAGSDTVGLLGGAASIHAFVPARSLLATTGGPNGAYEQNFVAWVTMWAVAFLLLFFALAGCHCLRTMRFKQDSLLYGKNKAA